jgi:hypothetical protein
MESARQQLASCPLLRAILRRIATRENSQEQSAVIASELSEKQGLTRNTRMAGRMPFVALEFQILNIRKEKS